MRVLFFFSTAMEIQLLILFDASQFRDSFILVILLFRCFIWYSGMLTGNTYLGFKEFLGLSVDRFFFFLSPVHGFLKEGLKNFFSSTFSSPLGAVFTTAPEARGLGLYSLFLLYLSLTRTRQLPLSPSLVEDRPLRYPRQLPLIPAEPQLTHRLPNNAIYIFFSLYCPTLRIEMRRNALFSISKGKNLFITITNKMNTLLVVLCEVEKCLFQRQNEGCI